jgi:hypothetical protein
MKNNTVDMNDALNMNLYGNCHYENLKEDFIMIH